MSFQSFFTNIKNAVENELNILFGQSKALIELMFPFFKSAAGAVAADLMPDALAIVTALAADPTKTGAQKQAAAASQLLDKAKTDGKTLLAATANFLVEAAYQTFLASKPSETP